MEQTPLVKLEKDLTNLFFSPASPGMSELLKLEKPVDTWSPLLLKHSMWHMEHWLTEKAQPQVYPNSGIASSSWLISAKVGTSSDSLWISNSSPLYEHSQIINWAEKIFKYQRPKDHLTPILSLPPLPPSFQIKNIDVKNAEPVTSPTREWLGDSELHVHYGVIPFEGLYAALYYDTRKGWFILAPEPLAKKLVPLTPDERQRIAESIWTKPILNSENKNITSEITLGRIQYLINLNIVITPLIISAAETGGLIHGRHIEFQWIRNPDKPIEDIENRVKEFKSSLCKCWTDTGSAFFVSLRERKEQERKRVEREENGKSALSKAEKDSKTEMTAIERSQRPASMELAARSEVQASVETSNKIVSRSQTLGQKKRWDKIEAGKTKMLQFNEDGTAWHKGSLEGGFTPNQAHAIVKILQSILMGDDRFDEKKILIGVSFAQDKLFGQFFKHGAKNWKQLIIRDSGRNSRSPLFRINPDLIRDGVYFKNNWARTKEQKFVKYI